MLLLSLVSVFLGLLTSFTVLVLSRLVLGIPLLGFLGGRAGGPTPPLPGSLTEVALLAAAGAGGFVTAWLAPSRPLAHALTLGLIVGSLAGTVAVVGPFGPDVVLRILLLPVAVVVGGWLRGRMAGSEPPSSEPERT